jgi:hypothetical protein
MPGRSLSLSADELQNATIDELLTEAVQARSLRLVIDKPVECDAVRVILLISVAARNGALVKVEFPYGQATRESAEALDRILLGPLLWSSAPRRNLSLSGTELRNRQIYFADPERKVFWSHTSDLSARTREEFRTDLANGLRAAQIFVPATVFNALSSIGFELNSNAEEYGALDEEGQVTDSFRVFSVSLQASLPPSQSILAAKYLHEYASTHDRGRAWIQVIVADSGVGMAYPNYFVRSTSADPREEKNIYRRSVREEQTQLGLVLEDYSSTKNSFGRRLNLQTAIGEGTKIVRHQIAAVRGFVGVRTGRCQATWSHASRTLTTEEFYRLGRFEVSDIASALFLGTVWQVLIPLDTQFGLL